MKMNFLTGSKKCSKCGASEYAKDKDGYYCTVCGSEDLKVFNLKKSKF